MPFDPADLPSLEERLEALGLGLDVDGPSTPVGIVAIALAQRARSLWFGLRHATDGPSDASVKLILRGLVELTILLPWLAKEPDLHMRLWVAEGEYQMLKLMLGAPANAGSMLAAGIAERASPDMVAKAENSIAAARASAMAAGVRGVGQRGSLIPDLAQMVDVIDTAAAREAYGVTFSPDPPKPTA